MKCLNCGQQTEEFLCPDCRSMEILDKVFNQVRYYKPETCENPWLMEYASGLTEKYAERDCLPVILSLFERDAAAFYYCQYYQMRRDPAFEETAITYVQEHPLSQLHTQRVLYDLLSFYSRNEFIKPQKWCEIISEQAGLGCELYVAAAEYYGMIGEYDLADAVMKKADGAVRILWSEEGAQVKIAGQVEQTDKWRNKPYWPSTEERRRAVAMFYDEKGIQYPRIKSRPERVPEDQFAPLNECFDEPEDYCAFWCSDCYAFGSASGIYEIAAVKVRDGKITDSFTSLIRPWDGISSRKNAAKVAGVSLDVIESAEDVDLVAAKFFAFVGEDALLSTDALGDQAKLLTRVARYSGMKEITNPIFDIMDLADDADVPIEHQNRRYLLEHFAITEGNCALEKAKNNVALYEKLKQYGA